MIYDPNSIAAWGALSPITAAGMAQLSVPEKYKKRVFLNQLLGNAAGRVVAGGVGGGAGLGIKHLLDNYAGEYPGKEHSKYIAPVAALATSLVGGGVASKLLAEMDRKLVEEG